MHEIGPIPSKLKKKYLFKDIKKIKKSEYNFVDIFFGARPKINSIKRFKNLKKVAFISRGIDLNLKDYLIKSKIKFYLLDKLYVKPVVATIFAYIFGLARGLDISFEIRRKKKLSKKNFDRYRFRLNNVYDESFLLVGFGKINKQLFQSLKTFTKNITIINRSQKKIKKYRFIQGLEKLKSSVKNKTFIINSLPLTPETKDIFNKEIFSNFKDNAILINIGRGETIDEIDLKKFFLKKNISLGFDVYQKENKRSLYNPIPKNYFFQKKFGNFFTPHTASYDKFVWQRYVSYLYKIIK